MMTGQYTAISLRVLRTFIFIAVVGWLSHAGAADLQLSWTDNSDNESGFSIERKTNTSGTFAPIANVGTNVTTYVDSGLAAATNFCYRVRAFNSAGNSAFTPEACKSTPAGTPPPLFDFSLSHGGNKSVIRGQSVSNAITATLVSGSAQAISFSTSGLPSGVTDSYSSSNSCTPTCSRTLNITTASSTATGSYPIRVSATGGGITKTTTFDLAVTASTSSDLIALEAENGKLTAPMVSGSDNNASNGKFVHVPDGKGSNHDDATNGGPGEVRFTISITQSGTRALWARTIAPNGSSDSFYVTRNGTRIAEWHVPGSTTWKWNKVANVSLSAGTVNLAFRQREDGTRLDQVILTPDQNYVPGQSTAIVAATAASETDGPVLSINVVKTLTNGGSGDGTVTSSPAGINCGSVCTHPYNSGTVIKLIATAAAGSTFTGWSGDADCKDGTVTMSTNTSCTATFNALTVSSSTSTNGVLETTALDQGITKVGVYRPGTGDIFLDRNGNGEWEGCSTDVCLKWLAQASGIPVAADWEGTGTTSIGTFESNSAAWYLDGNGNGRWDGCAVDFCINSFGEAGNVPVLGSDGTNGALLGVYRPKTASWQFDSNGNNVLDPCGVDTCYSNFGGENKFGLSGDWDGEGKTKIATFEAASGSWLIDANGNSVRDACGVDRCYSRFGQNGDIPVAGDWDGSGKTKIGIFRPSSGQWFLDKNGNGQLDSCGIDICINGFGKPGDKPVVGKWLGDSLGSGVSGLGF
ncbi:MAG TPA: hypothetical protein VHM64_20425 [Candidatus Binatia bacterium]|nr:hypothetical protein [Candidatus Binatia bacterium]